MITTNTYLNFNGTCEEAMNFYAQILGGKIIAMMKAEGAMAAHSPSDFQGKIMHARIQLGDILLMGSDSPQQNFSKPQGFAVNVNTDEPRDADRIYAALADGGTQTMPIAETFWARRFGMCTDRFGTPWMVNCEKPM